MEEEIEEKINSIFKFVCQVKWRDFRMYEVTCKIDPEKIINLLYVYDSTLTIDANVNELAKKIDIEISKLFRK